MKTTDHEQFQKDVRFVYTFRVAHNMLWSAAQFFGKDIEELVSYPDIREWSDAHEYKLSALADFIFEFVKQNLDSEVCLQKCDCFENVRYELMSAKAVDKYHYNDETVWRGLLSQMPNETLVEIFDGERDERSIEDVAKWNILDLGMAECIE